MVRDKVGNMTEPWSSLVLLTVCRVKNILSLCMLTYRSTSNRGYK